MRRFVHGIDETEGVLKLDFSNAFNGIRRDHVLESVYVHFPEIYNFCALAYNSPSILTFCDKNIWSAEGV